MFWSKSQTEEITREYQEWLGRGGEGWGGVVGGEEEHAGEVRAPRLVNTAPH